MRWRKGNPYPLLNCDSVMEISVYVPPKQKEIVEIDLPHAFDHKLN